MLHVFESIIIIVFLVALIFGGAKSKPVQKPSHEGIKRAGRVGLWAVLPPVGLWRSYRHGANKRRDQIIEEIKKDS